MFHIETLKQGGPDRKVMQELWQKALIPGADLSMLGKIYLGEISHGEDYQKTIFALIDENFEISLPLRQMGGSKSLLKKIAENNSIKNGDSNPYNLITNLGLKLGKNKKFLGPEILYTVDNTTNSKEGGTIHLKFKNFVLDNINLAEQLQSFGIYLIPSSLDKLI